MNTSAIENLYEELLTAWNNQDAKKMASLFTKDGISIGFDGSQYVGNSTIESEIGNIFDHHQTADYVWKIRKVRFLNPDVALLHAVVGMVPPGQKDVIPAANAIQCITAVNKGEQWSIALFQNTPAQFHGRPEEVKQLTEELRKEIRQ